ncbi:MAG: hypothetical protein ABW277_15355 [Longimicrobiaceae bacterium]
MTGTSLPATSAVAWMRVALLVLACVASAVRPPPAGAQGAPRSHCPAAEAAESCLLRALGDAHERLSTATDGLVWADSALLLLQDVCDRGQADGCYFAGRLLLTRVSWFAKDEPKVGPALEEAAPLFRRGCVSTRPPSAAACNSLGDALEFGMGVPVDADSAIVYYHLGCRLGDPTACSREAARLGKNPELGPDRSAIAERQSLLACRMGSSGGCGSVASFQAERLARIATSQGRTPSFLRQRDEMLDTHRRLCRSGAGLLTSCAELGAVFSDPRLGVVSGDSARRYYEFGCRGRALYGSWLGVGTACRGLAGLALAQSPPNTKDALKFYRIGCELSDSDSCANLGRMPHPEDGSVAGTFASLYLFVKACMAATPSSAGCEAAGGVFERELADSARARTFYRTACELGSGQGCGRLAVLADSVHDDAQTALKYYRRGCGLRHGSSCTDLAALLARDHGDQARADRLYALGCELGDAGGCWNAMLARRRAGDEVQEGLIRARACRLDRSFCKNNDLRLDEP